MDNQPIVRHCTKEHPMPESTANLGRWVHHDVAELQDLDTFGVEYKCNVCGLVFIADNSR